MPKWADTSSDGGSGDYNDRESTVMQVGSPETRRNLLIVTVMVMVMVMATIDLHNAPIMRTSKSARMRAIITKVNI